VIVTVTDILNPAMKNENLQLFLEAIEGTITKEEIIKNPYYHQIWESVLGSSISVKDLFVQGEDLSKKDTDQAQMFFLLLSLVSNLSDKHLDLATEAHLLVGGIEREDFSSVAEILELV